MEKIYWKDEYTVGVESLDIQHQRLFEILNKLIDIPAAAPNPELVSQTLSEMHDYATEHFADEEELMQQYGYPELELQKKQHAHFVKITAELSAGARHKQSVLPGELVEFLVIWLTLHILKCDMKYKDFFLARIPSDFATITV